MFVCYTCSSNYVCDAISLYVYCCLCSFLFLFPFLNKHVLPKNHISKEIIRYRYRYRYLLERYGDYGPRN